MTALWLVLAAGIVLVVVPSVLDRWAAGRASPAALVTLSMVSLVGMLLLPLAVAGCLAQSWGHSGAASWAQAAAATIAAVTIGRTVWVAYSVRRTARTIGCLAKAAATGRVEPGALVVAICSPPAFVAGTHVVVSSRLFDELPSDQVTAVLAHEIAHLRCRHARLAVWAHAIRRGLLDAPSARRAERRVRRELEVLADRAAATHLGHPGPVVAALTRLRGRSPIAPAMLFSGDDVDYRIRRLKKDQARAAGPDGVVIAGVAIAASAALGATCTALHEQWLGVGVATCALVIAGVWDLLRPLRVGN